MATTKHITDLSSNEIIREAIRAIALKGVVSQNTGTIRGTSKVTGYVAKIHDDESDPLYGTVDVQEYTNYSDDDGDGKIGFHEGVLLTAIQNNWEGYVIIPKLYSDVLVSQDPATGNEFVTMFSHVDLIQLDSHDKISIGVRDREEYRPDDENAPDIHELELTGVQSNTSYTKDAVVTVVDTEKDNSEATVTQVLGNSSDGVLIKHDVGGLSTSTITGEGIELTHDKLGVALKDSQVKLENDKSKVTVTNGIVYVGDDSPSGVDDAVLGRELASILSELVGYLGQMMTPTMMGPQPPANVLGSFIALRAKIQSFTAAHSGFLTSKVQIQK